MRSSAICMSDFSRTALLDMNDEAVSALPDLVQVLAEGAQPSVVGLLLLELLSGRQQS